MRPLLPCFGVVLLLAGCLEMEQVIVLESDGKGSQEMTLTLADTTLAEVRRAAAANQTGSSSDPLSVLTRATVDQELTAAGMQLVEHEVQAKGNGRTVHLIARFGDTATLRRSPLAGSSAEWEFAPGPVADTVRVTLYPQGKRAWVEARAKASAAEQPAGAVAGDFFARRRAQLAGLDVTLRFRLPGKVLRWTRNLEQIGENEVAAHITHEHIQTPDDLMRRLAPRFEVVFDSKGMQFPVDR